ncbi:MAG: outer membrane beta-barrel protein [Bacteroidia bacterium]
MKKKILLSGILIYFSASCAVAQTTATGLHKNTDLTLSFGPTVTSLKNKNISADEYKVIDNKNGFNMALSFNKYFNNRVGIGAGLGYSSYNQAVYQKGLFVKFSQIDRDGNSYDEWFDSDITSINKVSYLDVPVTLHLLLGNSNRFYGFIDAGIINQFLIATKCTEKGHIENMGKYPTNNPYFNLVSQNNSYYGYVLTYVNKNHDSDYKNYNLSGHFSFGVAASLTDNVQLKIQPYINIGFTDVNAKTIKGQDYKNVVGYTSAYESTKLFAAGLNIGIVMNIGS